MIPPVILLVDPRGWPSPLDPEVVTSMLQGRLQLPSVTIRSRQIGERWFDDLPREASIVFVLFTRPLVIPWQYAVERWLAPSHQLYVIHLDNADPVDMTALARLTVDQPVPRSAYRIAQRTPIGLEGAVQWMAGILHKFAETAPVSAPPVMPVLKASPARWRHLPSNQQDPYYYPEQLTVSMRGAAGYRMAAASHRGKTHAHQGTFREDAVALEATRYWNIMAVSDGAGTAELARVGSNMAVRRAVEAMRDAMPDPPATEDVGRAIWAELRAAYQSVREFAREHAVSFSELSATLQLLIHWPQEYGCLLGVAHIGDGIITAETANGNGQFFLLTDPDTDPEDSSRTLFLTSGPLKQWMERTRIYQFDEPLDIVALMTDGLSGDLEPYAELLHMNLFESLRSRVLCYPLPQREQAMLAFISYDRRGSFDDRTLAILSRT